MILVKFPRTTLAVKTFTCPLVEHLCVGISENPCFASPEMKRRDIWESNPFDAKTLRKEHSL